MDGRGDVRWYGRTLCGEGAWCFSEYPRNYCLRRRAGERWLASKHLVRHGAKRVHVGPSVDGPVTGRLLGGHVLRRTEREACLREAFTARMARRERNAKVGDQCAAVVGEQNVL